MTVMWAVAALAAVVVAVVALACVAMAATVEEAGDETSSFTDAVALADADVYAGHLDRVGDRADYFSVEAVQGTVVDVHVRITGHDGTDRWVAPPRTAPPRPPAPPHESCLLSMYICAGPTRDLAVDGAFNYYYIRDYCLSIVAPVPGTATYHVEVAIDWLWTPNNFTWDYSLDVRTSRPAEVAAGSSVTGTVDLDLRDTHWFQVRAPSGHQLHGSIEVLDFDAANPEHRNIDVWVFPDDMGGWPKATAWDWSTAPNEPVEPFSVLATYDGWYIIKLQGTSHDYNLPCSYRLGVLTSPVPEFPEGGVANVHLDRTRHDTDWYRFTMSCNVERSDEPGLWNDVICFNLTERADTVDLPDFDLYLFGLAPGARELDLLDSSFRGDHATFNDPDRDPNRPHEEVRAAAFYNGTYYVEVTAFNNTGYYDLRSEDRAGVLSDGDDLPLGLPLTHSGVYESRVHQALDHYDWYKVESKEYIHVQLAMLPLTGLFNVSVYRYDALSYRYVLVTGRWNSEYNATTRESCVLGMIDLQVQLCKYGLGSGTYYICVFAAVGADTGHDLDGRAFVYVTDMDARADYELRLWVDDSPPPPPPPKWARPIPDLFVDEDTDKLAFLELWDYAYSNDVDENPLRFKVLLVSGRLTELMLEGSIVGFRAWPDYAGKVIVKVTAQNRNFLQSTTLWNIIFLPVNDPPRTTVEGPLELLMVEDASHELDLGALFIDVDVGDALSFAIDAPDWVAVSLGEGGTVATLTPDKDGFGMAPLTVTATDSAGASTALAVTLVVENVEDPPVVIRPLGSVKLPEDSTLTIDLGEHFVDADPEPLTYLISATPDLGARVDPGTGVLVLTPTADWYGPGTVTVTAVDAAGQDAVGLLEVEVLPVPDPPELITVTPVPGTVTLSEGASTVFTVVRAVDPDRGPLYSTWYLDGRKVAVS
jgi:hypothetical protein